MAPSQALVWCYSVLKKLEERTERKQFSEYPASPPSARMPKISGNRFGQVSIQAAGVDPRDLRVGVLNPGQAQNLRRTLALRVCVKWLTKCAASDLLVLHHNL